MVELPSPSSLNAIWNFGSLLGLCLFTQLGTGIFLALHYRGDVYLAFESVRHICRDVNLGWIIRIIHSNGARIFFICLYMHIARGIYYSSYNFIHTWSVGVILLLLAIAAAFMGYVLPWGQISFWGATVITNLFSALPVIGEEIVKWIWGGFAVDNATLTRFFSFHFLIPFIISAMSMVHLLFLHQSGSNNPVGLSLNKDKIFFHPYFSTKDLFGFVLILLILGIVVFNAPWILRDPENFIPANPLVTPVHIQPEWYFLFAYAILRSIPNKLGGVLALGGSVVILFILPLTPKRGFNTLIFYPINKRLFWFFIGVVLILTWIGACPVEEPYVICGQIITVLYFSYYLIFFTTKILIDSIYN